MTAPSSDWLLQLAICCGWTSNYCASSASVFSPLITASATLALNAGECVWRLRLVILFSGLAARILAAVRQKIHSSDYPNLRSHLCPLIRGDFHEQSVFIQ